MSETRERYARIASDFGSTLQKVPAGAWDAPSPCPEWSAFDVAAHVIGTHRAALAGLDQREVKQPEQGEDLNHAWDEVMTAVIDALDDPAVAQTTTSGMFGEQSFESLVGRLLSTDTLIHTWDLAQATGQDIALDEVGVEKSMEMLTSLADKMRGPKGFGPEIESAPDDDAQTKLLNFAGRKD